ncbi:MULTISPECIES: DUF882 domain-containing protein [Nitrospirillum]|uniref:DUF882 domain-containing protein n=1 Tax=Nitrospirillum TaxID=1543705 RepID=UPI000AA57B70|nr:DUF882 domain-containing protein [Nitrospirillum amazonense]MEC4593407.1 DUF882 domain-containing protein [Nitrospirillum amazonense]TWB42393.1 uncharacterized protein YcbK (DUF882 family) [Nitrospirillum amazonense]
MDERHAAARLLTIACDAPSASDASLVASSAPAPTRRGLLAGFAKLATGAALVGGVASPLPALAKAATKHHGGASHGHSAAHGNLMHGDWSNARAATRPLSDNRRVLAFNHLHTGEKLKVTYWADGKYLPTALHDVNSILRDWRTNQTIAMDPKLLDLMFQMQHRLHTNETIQVICGYRCPKTNAMLAANSEGVASHSMHMEGKAIDLDLASKPLARIRQVAVELKQGGVGYYPKSNFVHVDTGRVRQWA